MSTLPRTQPREDAEVERPLAIGFASGLTSLDMVGSSRTDRDGGTTWA